MRQNRAKIDQKALKSERFISAVDYLIENKYVKGQNELAEVSGIHESTLSNIRNNKKNVTDKTIYKLLDAFPGVFNSDYFRLKVVHMLVADTEYFKQHPEEDAMTSSFYVPIDEREKQTQKPANELPTIPTWADTLISIMSKQIKQNEALTRELRQSIAEVNTLRDDLRRLIRGQYLPNINAGTYLATAEKDHAPNPNQI